MSRRPHRWLVVRRPFRRARSFRLARLARLSRLARWLLPLALLATPTPGGGEPELVSQMPVEWLQPFHGDLPQIAERGVLRVLTTNSRTHYFLDGARPRGLSYEAMEAFRDQLNQQLGLRSRPISFLYIPVARDQLIPLLAAGRGDIAIANLTVTDSRLEQVDFSAPLLEGVRELVVTGPGTAAPQSLADLSGAVIHARRSSSYFDSLEEQSRQLVASGLAPIEVREADEGLEDEDILQLVSAGVYPATVVDEHIADFWADVLEGLAVSEVAVREGARIAPAVRRGAPELRKALDLFAPDHKRGTLLGNVVLKRYLRENRWARGPAAASERGRLVKLVEHFRTYGGKYGFDAMLLAAQGYQESGLDPSVRSPAGAVGVMQILPATARSPEVGIEDVEDVEANIHAGAKYMRFLVDRYFSDPEIPERDRILLAFAAYNAGPARVRRLRAETAEAGLDPNRWFGNVEVIASRHVGRETVQYVGNISKYFIAYKLLGEMSDLEAGSGSARP